MQESIGALLRSWREHRRLSQLSLATDAEISARHLSFIETSRSAPSREMVLKLSEHLDLPLRERNRLLVAAGYAPVFTQAALEAPEMTPVHEVLQAILKGPYPAIVIDRRWSLIEANPIAKFLMRNVDPQLLQPKPNAMRIGLHPLGLAAHILNFRQWRDLQVKRLRREAEFSQDPVLLALYDEVSKYPNPEDNVEVAIPSSELVVPLRLREGDHELTLFNTVATFGTPVDVTVAELMVESFFPTGDASARVLAMLRGSIDA